MEISRYIDSSRYDNRVKLSFDGVTTHGQYRSTLAEAQQDLAQMTGTRA